MTVPSRIGWDLEFAGAAGLGVEGEADESFAVVDFACGDELHGFGEAHAEDFEVFVFFEGGFAGADVLGDVDLHPLAEEAGAGEVLDEHGPLFGAVAGLFDELALGCGERGFAGVAGAGRELDEELASGVAVLALEDDLRVAGVFGLVDGDDDDGPVVADDVADIFVATGLDDGVGKDAEDFTLIGELGRDELRLLHPGGGFGGGLAGWLGWGGFCLGVGAG